MPGSVSFLMWKRRLPPFRPVNWEISEKVLISVVSALTIWNCWGIFATVQGSHLPRSYQVFPHPQYRDSFGRCRVSSSTATCFSKSLASLGKTGITLIGTCIFFPEHLHPLPIRLNEFVRDLTIPDVLGGIL